nr:class I SAM-dependent methyltransferase [Salinimicrobium sediminis]
MAKTAGISPKRARLLNRLVRYLEVDSALELGSSLGLGTAAMAAGNRVKITTIEGCPETAAIAKEKFEEFNLKNIQLKVGRFEDFLKESAKTNSNSQIPNPKKSDGADLQSVPTHFSILNTHKSQPATDNSELLTHNFDLLFVDGNHQKEATLTYFKKLLPTVHNDSVMILDDIHWSKGMEEAWEEIKAHPRVKVTIDTFQWGLVFFRREQEKEHFVIRM